MKWKRTGVGVWTAGNFADGFYCTVRHMYDTVLEREVFEYTVIESTRTARRTRYAGVEKSKALAVRRCEYAVAVFEWKPR